MDSVGKECTTQMNYGGRAQRQGSDCPSLDLVLKKRITPFPQLSGRGPRGGGTGCLLLASSWAYSIWEHWERMEFGW